jgi:hypothetical protein
MHTASSQIILWSTRDMTVVNISSTFAETEIYEPSAILRLRVVGEVPQQYETAAYLSSILLRGHERNSNTSTSGSGWGGPLEEPDTAWRQGLVDVRSGSWVEWRKMEITARLTHIGNGRLTVVKRRAYCNDFPRI